MSSLWPADTFMVSTAVCVSFVGFRMASVPLRFPACFPARRPSRASVGLSGRVLENAWETSNCFPLSFTITSTEGVDQKMAEIKAYYRLLFPIITRGLSGGVWGLERGYC